MWSVYVNFIVIITLLQVLYYMKISHNWLSVAFHMSVFPCRFETHTLTRMQTTSLLYYHYHLLVMTSLSSSFHVFNYQSLFSKITTPNSNSNNNSDQITDGQIDKTYTLKYTAYHVCTFQRTILHPLTHTHTTHIPPFVQ